MDKMLISKIVKVGKRGEIVIPKEIREKLKIKKGERLLIITFQTKFLKNQLVIVKADEAMKALEKIFSPLLGRKMNIIECKNLTKIYNLGKKNETIGVIDINLKIKKGEKVVIFGPSGSGKSTLLHLIGCLDRPTRGKVFIEGKDVSKLSDDKLSEIRREKIGFIFQFFYLIPTLTALENVNLPALIAGKSNFERAKKLLEIVGLKERLNFKSHQLSGGEQQRVAIARALMNNPSIILADEPTGNLDSKTGNKIIMLLDKLSREMGKTLVIVTHNKEIKKIANRVIYMRDGKIIKVEKVKK